MNLSGAGSYFSASHRSARDGELHGHSYEVMAYWQADDTFDAEAAQEVLQYVVEAIFDHQTLPDAMARAEDIAGAIGKNLNASRISGCVRVDIWRPIERFRVEVWL